MVWGRLLHLQNNLRMNNTVLENPSNTTCIYILCALIFVVCGCQTTVSSKSHDVPRPSLLTVTNSYGISLKAAQDKSLNLEQGMTQAQVVLLLCKPNSESPKTFFPSGQNPWNGLVWHYQWGPRIHWFDRPNPEDTLEIIFEKHLNVWVVTTWIWSAP